MHLNVALAKHKEIQQHKQRIKSIKPNIKEDEDLSKYYEVDNGFLIKKKLK